MYTAHLNTNYRHFYLFVTEVSPEMSQNVIWTIVFMLLILRTTAFQFNLVDKKDMIPLAEFNDTIAGEYK
jgi:hypothetical protein